ncbi:hypothetical protein AVEN_98203-1 [Araneus ventricosus]|uniref:Uncharacterized protein n=1 Tax=Araneus ventricosus TaxID=182803 RepID=A0A4Y2LP47_ARAVE|nr:hypothetical protein AVEN_98203-1 [Araneus ventricosus]
MACFPRVPSAVRIPIVEQEESMSVGLWASVVSRVIAVNSCTSKEGDGQTASVYRFTRALPIYLSPRAVGTMRPVEIPPTTVHEP